MHAEHAAQAGDGVLRLVEHLGRDLHRRDEQRDEEQEGHQRAGRDVAGHAEQHADHDDRRVGQGGDDSPLTKTAAITFCALTCARVLPVDRGVDARGRPVADAVRADGRGADDGLGDGAEHVADALADDAVGARQPRWNQRTANTSGRKQT